SARPERHRESTIRRGAGWRGLTARGCAFSRDLRLAGSQQLVEPGLRGESLRDEGALLVETQKARIDRDPPGPSILEHEPDDFGVRVDEHELAIVLGHDAEPLSGRDAVGGVVRRRGRDYGPDAETDARRREE